MKILAVDDDDSIREMLTLQLKRNGYEVLTAADGEEALEKALDADFILLDVMLPKLDGYEVCRHLKASPDTAEIPVIMLTAKSEEIDTVLGLELGADDYIVKPFSMRELIARIKAVLRRTEKSSKKGSSRQLVIHLGPLVMDLDAYRAELGGKELSLTPKEYELLKLFLSNPGTAFTRDQLFNTIWGMDYCGESRTVDMHIRTLRQKLGRYGSLIETVRGVGYRLEAKA